MSLVRSQHTLVLLAAALSLVSCSSKSSLDNADSVLAESGMGAGMGAGSPAWTMANVPVASAVVMANRYPRADVEFPGGVTGMPDLIYSDISGHRPLRLDMYVPPDRSRAYPMVMYVHGGGWRNGHSRQSGAFEDWPSTLAMIASRGFVVTSLNYRLSEEAPFPAAIQDVKTALRWLRANAEEYGIDKDKFLIWGASAGGHLAALAATSCGIDELEPVDLTDQLAVESDCVQAAIGWYGIYGLMDAGPGDYFGDHRDVASPSTHVDPTDGQFLLIHGSTDSTVDPSQSADFQQLVTSHGLSSDLHIIPGVGHSYRGETADETRAASIRALELSIAFIEEVFERQD